MNDREEENLLGREKNNQRNSRRKRRRGIDMAGKKEKERQRGSVIE